MNAFEQGKKKPEKTAGDNQWVTAHQKSRTDKRPRRDGPGGEPEQVGKKEQPDLPELPKQKKHFDWLTATGPSRFASLHKHPNKSCDVYGAFWFVKHRIECFCKFIYYYGIIFYKRVLIACLVVTIRLESPANLTKRPKLL